MNAPFTVVYDASVLFSARLRDLLVRLALTDLFRAKWTNDIHKEWIRAVCKRRSVDAERLERTRKLMDAAVRDCLVGGYGDLIEKVRLPDQDDRHVVAAAIKSGAQTIVTFNLRDFPLRELQKWDIEARHPDAFIVDLMGINLPKVIEAVRAQREALVNPPVTPAALVDGLERNGLRQTAARLRVEIKRI